MQRTPQEPRPVDFPEANFTYKAPKGMEENCGDLRCYRAPGMAVSCWRFPSFWERMKFLFSGKIWFYCVSDSHPPISLAVHKPPFPKQ